MPEFLDVKNVKSLGCILGEVRHQRVESHWVMRLLTEITGKGDALVVLMNNGKRTVAMNVSNDAEARKVSNECGNRGAIYSTYAFVVLSPAIMSQCLRPLNLEEKTLTLPIPPPTRGPTVETVRVTTSRVPGPYLSGMWL